MSTLSPREILDGLDEPAFLLRSSGSVIEANEAACLAHRIEDAGPFDLVGMVSGEPAALLEYLSRCATSAVPVNGEVVLRSPGKEPIRYRTTGKAVRPAGHPDTAVILVRCAVPGEESQRTREEIDRDARASLEEALAARDVLIRELHHRVKNNLQLLLSLFMMGERRETDDIVRGKLRDARMRVQSMAKVQKLLYQTESATVVNIADFLRELGDGLVSAHAVPGARVVVDSPSETLSLEGAVPLGLIVNELVSNALIHASPSEIRITLRKRDERFELVVADDGEGMADGSNPEGASGIRLMRGLAQQLRGQATLKSSRPVCWKIEFTDPGPVARVDGGAQ